jgi:prophage regulatory protein
MAAAPRFLAVKTVADEIAISEAQVYTILRSGELPAIQVGPKKVWRVERVKLGEYIERQYAAARESVASDEIEPSSKE